MILTSENLKSNVFKNTHLKRSAYFFHTFFSFFIFLATGWVINQKKHDKNISGILEEHSLSNQPTIRWRCLLNKWTTVLFCRLTILQWLNKCHTNPFSINKQKFNVCKLIMNYWKIRIFKGTSSVFINKSNLSDQLCFDQNYSKIGFSSIS